MESLLLNIHPIYPKDLFIFPGTFVNDTLRITDGYVERDGWQLMVFVFLLSNLNLSFSI